MQYLLGIHVMHDFPWSTRNTCMLTMFIFLWDPQNCPRASLPAPPSECLSAHRMIACFFFFIVCCFFTEHVFIWEFGYLGITGSWDLGGFDLGILVFLSKCTRYQYLFNLSELPLCCPWTVLLSPVVALVSEGTWLFQKLSCLDPAVSLDAPLVICSCSCHQRCPSAIYFFNKSSFGGLVLSS